MVAHLPHVAKGGEAAPVAMAQGEPEYNQGAYPDRSVCDFFQHTLAKSYWDDDEELEKIGTLSKAYDKQLQVDDVAGMLVATVAQHNSAIGAVYPATAVDGMRNKIFRYLGPRGTPHKPEEGSWPHSHSCAFVLDEQRAMHLAD